jgi:hypothetical protein
MDQRAEGLLGEFQKQVLQGSTEIDDGSERAAEMLDALHAPPGWIDWPAQEICLVSAPGVGSVRSGGLAGGVGGEFLAAEYINCE